MPVRIAGKDDDQDDRRAGKRPECRRLQFSPDSPRESAQQHRRQQQQSAIGVEELLREGAHAREVDAEEAAAREVAVIGELIKCIR